MLWDLLPSETVLGGASTNFIYRLNSFGDYATLLSKVGNDLAGRDARNAILKLGISDEYIQTDYEFPTGSVEVRIEKNGIPDFNIMEDVAYDHIDINNEMIDVFSQADCIYFGTLVQRHQASKKKLCELIYQVPDTVKFLDINLRKNCYTIASVKESLLMANILKTNDEELMIIKELFDLKNENLKDLAMEIITTFNLEIVLCTLGPFGAFCITQDNSFFYDSGYQISIVDTVGSGDAFSAGFVHYYMNGKDIEKALHFGNAAGAMIATTLGATSPISKEQIIDFMNISNKRNNIRLNL